MKFGGKTSTVAGKWTGGGGLRMKLAAAGLAVCVALTAPALAPSDAEAAGRCSYNSTRCDSDGDGYSNGRESSMGEKPYEYCAIMRADVDGDGTVTTKDLAMLSANFLKPVTAQTARLDQDGDGMITLKDMSLVSLHFLKNVQACA